MRRQELRPVRQGFEEAFREYGLPDIIRSDNGRPLRGLGLEACRSCQYGG